MLTKHKSLLLTRNLALGTFGELLIVFSKRGKSAIPPLFNSPEMLPSASDKAKLFVKNFSKNFSKNYIIFPSGPDCIPVVVLKNCELEFHTY